MKTIKFMKHNIGQLTGFIISMYVAYMLGTGKILNYIEFADPLNEMVMFMLCVFCATCSLLCLEKSNC
jgi:hypothetical protein